MCLKLSHISLELRRKLGALARSKKHVDFIEKRITNVTSYLSSLKVCAKIYRRNIGGFISPKIR